MTLSILICYCFVQWLLADLYFSVTLEFTKRRNLSLFYIISLIKKMTQVGNCVHVSKYCDCIIDFKWRTQPTMELRCVRNRKAGSNTSSTGETGLRALPG